MPAKIQSILQSLGYTVEYQQETPGGAYLTQHAQSGSGARLKIQNGYNGNKWDYVIANGNTMEPANDYTNMLAAAKILKEDTYLYNPNAKFILHSTNHFSPSTVSSNSSGVYTNSNLMANDVDTKYASISQSLGIKYGPNTKGIQKLYNDGIKGVSDIWNGDGKHHTDFSHYMAACIYAAMISGIDPTCFTQNCSLSQADADYAKSVAKEVIINSNQGITLVQKYDDNLALGKTATTSTAIGGNTATAAFDGSVNSRWESASSNPQWITVDLGASYSVTGAKFVWETAAGKDYKIQVSADNAAWTDAYTKTNGIGGTENITFTIPVTGRYVRMYGTARTTVYGFSLWEFEVYGTSGTPVESVATPVITPASGTYTAAQSVTISGATVGATIRYTTDGSTPTATSGTVYSGAFNVAATATVKAIAYKNGMTSSNIASSIITINITPITSNIALNKTATASSIIGGNTAAMAVDSSANTRWESASSNPQWITVDLGASYSVTGAKLVWETAAGKDYKIQVSADNASWTDAYTKTNGTGGTENITFTTPITGRYVRMHGTARTTNYGYSLWQFEVYGTAQSVSTNFALNKTATASSVFGGNTAEKLLDGNSLGTRWESTHGVDPQWITVDLGENKMVSKVVLKWETASAKDYTIQTSTDATNWTTASTITAGVGGTETKTFSATTARYVRMYGTARNTGYGYSIWEFEVY